MTKLQVNGMTCPNCARQVTDAIQSVPGVRSASVILETGRADVRWSSDAQPDVPAVIEAVKQAGYEAKEVRADTSAGCETEHTNWQLNLWLGVFVTAALMIGEWGFGLGPETVVPVAFLCAGRRACRFSAGAQFYRGAWSQLKIGSSNMDTLVALGSTTAFGYSAWALFERRAAAHLYFMEAAAIITLISTGTGWKPA